MSIEELSRSLGRDIDHILECLDRLSTTKRGQYDDSDLLNEQIVREICKISRLRPVFINRSNTEKKVEGELQHHKA